MKEFIFDEDKYIERLEKLLNDLKIAEAYSTDTTVIIAAIEEEINKYLEYKNLKQRTM